MYDEDEFGPSLNYTCFKYFMKMTRTKGFRNSKNQSQD